MIGPLFSLALKAAKKVPWWKVLLTTAATAAAVTVANAAAQKTIDKLYKDKSKPLEDKLAEAKRLHDLGQITAEEHKKVRDGLLEQYAKA